MIKVDPSNRLLNGESNLIDMMSLLYLGLPVESRPITSIPWCQKERRLEIGRNIVADYSLQSCIKIHNSIILCHHESWSTEADVSVLNLQGATDRSHTKKWDNSGQPIYYQDSHTFPENPGRKHIVRRHGCSANPVLIPLHPANIGLMKPLEVNRRSWNRYNEHHTIV